MSDPKLLKRIAAIPAGEKLPLSRFAREFNCSVSVVWTMVERLVEDGKLDHMTMRPPVPAADGQDFGSWLFEGAVNRDVGKRVKAIAAEREISICEASRQIFGCGTQLSRLGGSDGRIGPATIAKIQAWLTGAPLPQAAEQGRANVPVARREEGAGGSALPAPEIREGMTGAELAVAIEAEAERRGEPVARFLAPLANAPWVWLAQLRKAKRPRLPTILRVRALFEGTAIPDSVNKQEQEARAATTAQEQQRLRDDREAAELAQQSRKPGETLAEAVRREAEALGARRRSAHLSNATNFLESDEDGDDPDVGSFAAARRAREQRDLSTPSALIRRAHQEWPERCNQVAAIAVQMGVKLGEAWDQVIGAGILALRDDLREESDGGGFGETGQRRTA